MSHLHLYNRKNPKENGPIVLFLTHNMNNPIPLINGDLVACSKLVCLPHIS
jgi:hypothetical protein